MSRWSCAARAAPAGRRWSGPSRRGWIDRCCAWPPRSSAMPIAGGKPACSPSCTTGCCAWSPTSSTASASSSRTFRSGPVRLAVVAGSQGGLDLGERCRDHHPAGDAGARPAVRALARRRARRGPRPARRPSAPGAPGPSIASPLARHSAPARRRGPFPSRATCGKRCRTFRIIVSSAWRRGSRRRRTRSLSSMARQARTWPPSRCAAVIARR